MPGRDTFAEAVACKIGPACALSSGSHSLRCDCKQSQELPPSAQKHVLHISQLLERVEEQLRRLAHELRPTILDDLGLLPALRILVEGVSKRTRLPITVTGFTDGRLPPPIETALYRSVQEALANVTKHARATKVRVEIQRNSSNVRCSISDNGQGMDVPAVLRRQGERGLGLIGIRERLDPFRGTVDLKSAPGRGTEVIISLVDHVSTDRGV